MATGNGIGHIDATKRGGEKGKKSQTATYSSVAADSNTNCFSIRTMKKGPHSSHENRLFKTLFIAGLGRRMGVEMSVVDAPN